MRQINIFSSFSFLQNTNKKYLLYLFVTVAFLVYGFSFDLVYASTVVESDVISEDTTWTLDGSPYIIGGSIMVEEGATLTIDPGVVVKIDPEAGDYYYKPYIYAPGNIIANGTEDLPIYFTSNYDDEVGGSTDADYEDCYYEEYDENGDPIIGEEVCEVMDWGDPSTNDWGGIYFRNSSGSYLKNVFFEYAKDALEIESSTVNFENLHISHSASGITAHDNSRVGIVGGDFHDIDNDLFTFFVNSSLDLKNAEIKNANYGYFISIFSNSSAVFDGVSIDGDGLSNTPIVIFNDSSLVFNKSSVSDTGDGLLIFNNSSAVANDSSLTCSNDGIDIYNNSTLNISSTDISCTNNGISLFSEVTVDINNVKITNATNAGILAFSNSDLSKINITKSEITGNEYGFIVWDTPISVHQSSIHDNLSYGAVTYPTDPLPTNIDFTSNYWGDPSGPTHISNPLGTGDGVSDNILFNPFLKTDPLKNIRNPVIIIPGITGSYLYKDYGDKGEIWPDAWNTIFSIYDTFLKDLTLNIDGTENSEKPLKVGDIIRNVDSIGVHVFDSLINELTNTGYIEGIDLFVFPYDWRFGTESTAGLLKEKIDQILLDSGEEQVDIIAHSMGGLVAKKYMADYGEDKVGQLIFLGTPQLGAPKAFKALMFGDSMGFSKFGASLLKLPVAKFISQNMPSVYELLPSSKYIEENGSYITNAMNEIIIPGSSFGLDYQATKNLMIDKGRNELMFPFAEELHNGIDNLDLSNIKSYNFVGCGSKTIGGINVTQKRAWEKLFLGLKDDFNLKYVNGDETVPLVSANGTIGSVIKYVKDITHGSLPSASGVRENILAILKGEDMVDSSEILNNASSCNISGDVVSTHSPVELHIYDEGGNHVGPNESGDIEYGIEGVSYDVLDEVKYAFLPSGLNYKIITKATDTGGYNFKIENQDKDDNITSTYDWKLIPLTTLETTGEIWVGPDYSSDNYEVKIDENGDGSIDEDYQEGFDGTELAEKLTKKGEGRSRVVGSLPHKNEISNEKHNFIFVEDKPEDNMNNKDKKITLDKRVGNKDKEGIKNNNENIEIFKDKNMKNSLLASVGSIENHNNRLKVQLIVVGAFALLILSLKFIFKVI